MKYAFRTIGDSFIISCFQILIHYPGKTMSRMLPQVTTFVKEDAKVNSNTLYCVEIIEEDCRYDMSSGTDIVHVDMYSGLVRLKQALDYEHHSRYNLTVTVNCFDGRFKNDYFMNIDVMVVNVNDNSPVFTRTLYECEVNFYPDRAQATYGRFNSA